MNPTILMVPQLPARFVERLKEDYQVLGPLGTAGPGALPLGAAEVRALLTMGTLTTDAALIDALPSLELICCYGTGFEGVDRAHAASRGIAIANAGSANADAVAEYAIGLMLATTRQIASGDRFVRAGSWKGNSVERMPMRAGLSGRRVGIYGLGAIGTRIARLAAGFSVQIGYHNRSARTDVAYLYHDSLIGLAEWADILVVAARAGASNYHAVDARVLAALGPEGHLVNISRGIIGGAALDVFEREPQVPARLKALPNIVLTPHIAANATSAQEAQQSTMLANLAAFFGGKPLVSEVR
ncbi:2-hydroxyacid dehydrogenase [Lichenihabitans sp. PAMC28606]|uniref:2-hydroxyacid dehydrogenase n=1 Tax=Lichenihabitans sp. PAMC28606 TaxID=2880932 RepID=UPI001D0A4BAD|nr:2-hydroxyacid dehydrogenase [Lichenihabitans sp. PAMC28606]UDL93525.1 2-hydroxyacid dehydrogenase [Lichenihabitans sp. PAMC28606]